jgi:hypothetical protein
LPHVRSKRSISHTRVLKKEPLVIVDETLAFCRTNFCAKVKNLEKTPTYNLILLHLRLEFETSHFL